MFVNQEDAKFGIVGYTTAIAYIPHFLNHLHHISGRDQTFRLQRVPAYKKLVFSNQADQFLINEKKFKGESG